MNHRRTLFLIATTVFAFFPVIRWYFHRLDDGGGEALGMIPLLLAVIYALREPRQPSYRAAMISLVVYAVTFPLLPPLLRAVPALATVSFLLGIHRHAGLTALLFLSLPVQASLDFFLGYPFRLLTAEGSRLILEVVGLPVNRVGVQLSIKDVIVSVDPPCSGLQMLWATCCLTAILATVFRITWRHSFLLGLIALFLCLLGNTLRATILFFPESGRLNLPEVAHVGVGALIFIGAAGLLALIARRWQGRPASRSRQSALTTPFFSYLAGLSGIFVLNAPALSLTTPSQFPELSFYRGHVVESLPLSPFEKSFSETFPGQINLYRVGHQTLIVRHVNHATRRLHSSAHCLQGEGFSLGATTLFLDEEGEQWLRYEATRFQEKILVSERICSLTTRQEWSTISSWYWHALFNPQAGPWQAQTLITPIL